MDCRAASHFVGSRPRLRGGRLFAGMTEVGDWMPPGSPPPGPVELPGGWTRLALAARPVRGLRRMSIALRILPSPYPLQHWPVLGGSASTFEADDGLLPAGRYDTDPISRRERGHIERTFALQHWPETEGAGVMASGMPTGCPVMCGVGGTTYSVVKVRSGGLAPWPVGPVLRVYARAGRSRLRHNQHSSVACGLRVFVVVGPRP